MKKTLTIFVCSTFTDLQTERESVLEAIRKLQHQHDSMEYFGARTNLPIETCLEEVRRSDVLVVIVGYRYGSLVPEKQISFTEAEYQEGYSLGKPCLVYFRDENIPILPKFIERDSEKVELLEKFKKILQQRHTIAKFKDAQDIATSVSADLSRTAQAIEETSINEKSLSIDFSTTNSELNKLIKSITDNGIDTSVIISTIRRSITQLLQKNNKVRKPYVFFSYSQKDQKIVKQIADGLVKNNIDVWIDIGDLYFGDSIVERIEQGLYAADFFAYFLSKNSIESKWTRMELNYIITSRLADKSKVIIPIILDDVEVPTILRDVLYLDLRGRVVEYAVNALRNIIKSKFNSR